MYTISLAFQHLGLTPPFLRLALTLLHFIPYFTYDSSTENSNNLMTYLTIEYGSSDPDLQSLVNLFHSQAPA